MSRRILPATFAVVLGACAAPEPANPGSGPDAPATVKGLKNAASFASIGDDQARAQALFAEAGKVLTHARCVNCHPAGDRPLQTDAMRLHEPPVVRGQDGHGAAGLKCQTCHANENANLIEISMPGHEHWHLAPASMAWQGKSVGAICAQVKDRARNGDRDIAAIVKHMAEDGLVGWAWNPGPSRSPAPGTQAVFGGLIQAWAAAGAHCPPTTAVAQN